MSIGRILIFWSFLTILCLAPASASSISQSESVLTQHNDSARTGVFRNETRLTPQSVRNLEPLYTRKVEGQIAAQPLFVKGVMIGGFRKNVLYVVTRKNYIYAFDVDNKNQDDPRNGQAWPNPIELTHRDPEQGVMRAQPLPGMDDVPNACQQTHGPVGITSTPVIDPVQQVMYVVFRVGTKPQPKRPHQRAPRRYIAHHVLVAIDIQTGRELRRVEIAAPTFKPTHQLNRPGLLLMPNPVTKTNVLYVAFAAPVCDQPQPYDGWVFAYSAPDLRLLDTYIAAPQTHGAGIWQSGSGLAGAVESGFVYATTGNNSDPVKISYEQSIPGDQVLDQSGVPRERDRYDPSRTDLGDSILRLRLGAGDKFACSPRYRRYIRTDRFCVTDHFTAGNWFRLDTGYKTRDEWDDARNNKPGLIKSGGDSDLGSGGPVVLANGWVIAGGKQGMLYVLDPADMHHARQAFQFSFNTWHPWKPHSDHRECRSIADPDPKRQGFAINPSTPATPDHPEIDPLCTVSTEDYDFDQAYGPNIHGAPVVWQRNTSDFGYAYVMGEKDYLRAYKVYRSGRFEQQAVMTTEPPHGLTAVKVPIMFKGRLLRSPDGMPGAALSLSANGDKDGVVWVSLAPGGDAANSIEPGILMAFDAETLELLWSSEQDDNGQVYFAKFVPPTIASGRVFRATFGDHDEACKQAATTCGSVIVYGLRQPVVVPQSR